MSEAQNQTFKAEIKQLLDILIHSLYKEKEIFLRELVSNASDALTRLQFEMLTNDRVVNPEAELGIYLEAKKPEEGEEGDSWLIIKDTGIGMTAEELARNLGTIAQSGAREFLGKLREQGDEKPDLNDVIGQFGVGFYSVFMAADEVKVISRSFDPDAEAAMWISDGGDTFRIEAAEKVDRGTEIHIKLRTDSAEFADVWHLKQVVKKHSDFVAFPVYVDGEQANQQESLWRKRPADVEDEAYNSFYQMMTMDFEPPVSTIHFSSDAPLNLRSLLFIPAKREKMMFHKRQEPGLMLYCKNVLIQEYTADLLPKWLQFIDGVVDSEDVPLNVSRESVQNTRIMRQLGKTLKRRVLREVKKLLNDEEKQDAFWGEFGRFFKEGLAMAFEDRDDIMPLLRFQSSKSDGKLMSLDSYIGRMQEGQEKIYYVTGDNLASAENSPHLDPLKERDIEVLYLVDAYDMYMSASLRDYEEKPFQNVADADLGLPESEEDETAEESEDTAADESFDGLVTRFKDVLGERVVDVVASKVLSGSPYRLVAGEGEAQAGVSRLQRFVDQDFEIPKRTLELNRKHAMVNNIINLMGQEGQEELVNLSIEQLFDSALLQEGLHPNPAEIVPRMQRMIELATQA